MLNQWLAVPTQSSAVGAIAMQFDASFSGPASAGRSDAVLLAQETIAQGALLSRQAGSIWSDPVLATVTATVAVSLLLAGVWLFRRRSRQGRGAALVCLIVSLLLHLGLIVLLPQLKMFGGGSGAGEQASDAGGDSEMVYATFDPAAPPAASATADAQDSLQPLPLPAAPSLAADNNETTAEAETEVETQSSVEVPPSSAVESVVLPPSLRPDADAQAADDSLHDLVSAWLADQVDAALQAVSAEAAVPFDDELAGGPTPASYEEAATNESAPAPETLPAHVFGVMLNDFANRFGTAKSLALLQTGGDESTEAAVERALRFLAAEQRPDGAWDPTTSGAGRETLTLGTDRKAAGRRATTGLTGLALLSMLGAGNTHQQGPFADHVRRGLTYLILNQKPDGSLAGEAGIYEANYCHGLAALAMCEAAALTGDPSAIDSAAAAVAYTMAMQHPTTGGWRYVRGDPGDMSLAGWHAMVLAAGRIAGVPTRQEAFDLTGRFVRSVRTGPQGGLASYRPGDLPTHTMTAEALATRLLLGERIPPAELKEAEDYLLRQLPGTGRDNYYGWYYTSLALHHLQDDAWQTWNAAMKRHLLARQTPSGSWPTDSEWGGYGGRIYTTAMGALCLEVYYRHLWRGTQP